MAGSFTLLSKPGKKISLERSKHPCPKCKHPSSVQLIRSEKQLIILNKCVSNMMRVRYECSSCSWKNQELPIDSNELNYYQNIISSYYVDAKSTTMYPY